MFTAPSPKRSSTRRTAASNRRPTANRNAKPSSPFKKSSFLNLDKATETFRTFLLKELIVKVLDNVRNLDENEFIGEAIASLSDNFSNGILGGLVNLFDYLADNEGDVEVLSSVTDNFMASQASPLMDYVQRACSGESDSFDFDMKNYQIDESIPLDDISGVMQNMANALGDVTFSIDGSDEQRRRRLDEEISCASNEHQNSFYDAASQKDKGSLVLQAAMAIDFPSLIKFQIHSLGGGADLNLQGSFGVEAGLNFHEDGTFGRVAGFVGLVGQLSLGSVDSQCHFSGSQFDSASFAESFSLGFGLKYYFPGRSGDLNGWGGLDIGIGFPSNIGCIRGIILSLGHNFYRCNDANGDSRRTDLFNICERRVYISAITIPFASFAPATGGRPSAGECFVSKNLFKEVRDQVKSADSTRLDGFSLFAGPGLFSGLYSGEEGGFDIKDNFANQPYNAKSNTLHACDLRECEKGSYQGKFLKNLILDLLPLLLIVS